MSVEGFSEYLDVQTIGGGEAMRSLRRQATYQLVVKSAHRVDSHQIDATCSSCSRSGGVSGAAGSRQPRSGSAFCPQTCALSSLLVKSPAGDRVLAGEPDALCFWA
jgi:hypothetical protein